MIWLSIIDLIFEGLHNLLSLFGAQWLSNQTIFQYFGNYIIDFILNNKSQCRLYPYSDG